MTPGICPQLKKEFEEFELSASDFNICYQEKYENDEIDLLFDQKNDLQRKLNGIKQLLYNIPIAEDYKKIIYNISDLERETVFKKFEIIKLISKLHQHYYRTNKLDDLEIKMEIRDIKNNLVYLEIYNKQTDSSFDYSCKGEYAVDERSPRSFSDEYAVHELNYIGNEVDGGRTCAAYNENLKKWLVLDDDNPAWITI